MSMDSVIELGKACGRELSQAEAARLREVGSRLHLREDDALWPLLAAMEYQRVYYEALPEKIAGASEPSWTAWPLPPKRRLPQPKPDSPPAW